MQLDRAFDAFLTSCRVERGLSRHTVEAYARDLSRLAERLGAADLSALTPQALSEHIGELNTSGKYAPATVRRHIATLRCFCRYLHRRRLLPHNPFPPHLRAPRSSPLPQAISYAEVQRLLSTPDTRRLLGVRDRALLETLYASGMRVSECCGLELADLDLDAGFARVRGKGGKVRLCPLGDYAVEWLRRYLAETRTALPPSARSSKVFLSRRGELSRVHAFRLVRAYAAGAGITVRVTPHTLRHSFATHLLENGADIRVVQELLGHASISTVEFYTRVVTSKLRQVYTKAHPHA